MSFLKNIQSKSSSAKAGYTFGIAFVVTGIIAVFWVSTFPSKFSQIASEENTEKEGKDFGDLLDEAGSQLGSIVDTTKDTVNALNETTREQGRLDTLGQGTDPTFDSVPVVSNSNEIDRVVTPDTLEAPVSDTSSPTTTTPMVPAILSTTSTPESVPTPEPVVTREPRVILIGTTTSSTTSP